MAVASTLWVRDADPDPDIRYPWIGTGLMPVMLMGVTIAATHWCSAVSSVDGRLPFHIPQTCNLCVHYKRVE